MAMSWPLVALFISQLADGKELTVTNPEMTRFLMSLDSSVDLALYAFEHGQQGDIFVQKVPVCAKGTSIDNRNLGSGVERNI